MLPFGNRPWAKAVARTVIVLSVIAAASGAYYCYDTDQLHISEMTIIGLFLLLMIPPNVAIIVRKTSSGRTAADESTAIGQQPHLRVH